MSLALAAATLVSAKAHFTQYVLKPPAAPVPGRFEHWTSLALACGGLALGELSMWRVRQAHMGITR